MALTQVNSAGIKDDAIVNADIKSDAAIAGSKLAAATTSVAGSMSAADKTKLDGVATSANAYVHPNHSGDVTSTADGATVIAAGAVDIAMLATGTDGKIITWDASGNPTTVGPGTSGQVLTSGGAGAAPTFADAAAGLSSDAQSNTVGGTDAGGEFSGTDATNNTLLGHDAGKKITTGDWNVAIGDSTLTGNGSNVTGSSNTAVGPQALFSGTSVADSVAVGSAALYSQTTGYHNVAVGRLAGYTNSTGLRNTFIGQEAGKESTSNDSVFVGRQSGISVSSGTGQVMIGDNAGKGCQTGSYNVCIGLQAGKDQISADHSHRLWIARSDTPAGNGATWIYGSDGGACTQGNNSSSWTTTSDQRLKKDITDNTVGLSVIDNVKVRNYKYKQYTKTPEQLYDINDTEVQNGTKTIDDIKVARSFAPVSSDDVVDVSQFPKAGGDVGKVLLGQGNTAVQLGVVAQELESVAPNCVITDDNGVKSVDTDELFWHMLNAIKELSTKVKALEAG